MYPGKICISFLFSTKATTNYRPMHVQNVSCAYTLASVVGYQALPAFISLIRGNYFKLMSTSHINIFSIFLKFGLISSASPLQGFTSAEYFWILEVEFSAFYTWLSTSLLNTVAHS